jgi:hypothetical protein
VSDFYDISDPGEFLPEPSTPWWVWAIVVAMGAFIIIGTILWFRKNRAVKLKYTHLDKVLKELQQLRKETAHPPHVIALRLSLIIRHYLATTFEDPALFETDEEFSLRESALKSLPTDSRLQITDYLHTLSQIKYAPRHTEINTSHLIDNAKTLITRLSQQTTDPPPH